VNGFLTWIESSALGHFVRESGAWTYPIVNLAHVLGIATLFGSVLVLDLALISAGWRIGKVPQSGLPVLAATAAPLASVGFLLAVMSGVGLLSSNATDYNGNPFFMIKFPVIAIAFANAVAVRRSDAWSAIGSRELAPHEVRQLARMGGLSLVCWTGAITAGRMIGYW
jgi:hypothetical protein